jgi:hypothetical protein
VAGDSLRPGSVNTTSCGQSCQLALSRPQGEQCDTKSSVLLWRDDLFCGLRSCDFGETCTTPTFSTVTATKAVLDVQRRKDRPHPRRRKQAHRSALSLPCLMFDERKWKERERHSSHHSRRDELHHEMANMSSSIGLSLSRST